MRMLIQSKTVRDLIEERLKVNPVRTFDQITQEILDKYDYKTITVGILIADGNQTAARDYIINYMDKFDKESGKYIDFFVPGYCERISNSTVSIEKRYHPNAYEKWICMDDLPMFIIRRNQTAYYFDKFLFDDFIEEMETKMCIEYTYNPMLVLVEVNKSKDRGKIEFQNKMVIELDEDSDRGVTRAGILFNRIFEVAKQEVGLDGFKQNVRMYYIKGHAVNNIIRAIQGDWLESVENVVGDIKRFRIKKNV